MNQNRAAQHPGAPKRVCRLKLALILADTLALLIGVVVAFGVQMFLRPVPPTILAQQVGLLVMAAPVFAIAAHFQRLYQSRANESRRSELRNVVTVAACGSAGLLAASFAVQFEQLSRLWVFTLFAATVTTLATERQVARAVFARLRRSGRVKRRIIIVGTDAHAAELIQTYGANPSLGYEVVGVVGTDGPASVCGLDVLGRISQLGQLVADHQAVGVVVSLPAVCADDVNSITRQLTDQHCHVALSASLNDIDVNRLRPQQHDGRTMLYVEPVVRDGWRAGAKRAFDVALASLLLTLSLPILLATAVAIRFDSKGPVLFRQVRVGRNGEHFRIVKFRTMTTDAEQRLASLAALNESDGALFKITDDPRVTRVGRFLRKLSIDELPQLWCVLRGTMSMVGPRPALPDEVRQWEPALADRLRVLPGLTGLWQVSGRSNSSFSTYKRLDLYYVDNWSLRHDIEICARTLPAVLSGRGAA